MGVRHVVLFRFSEGPHEEEVARLEEALSQMPARVPEIRSYSFGSDLGLVTDNFDYVVVGDFDDEEDYRRYARSEAHVELVEWFLRPLMQERAAVQYQT